MKNILIFALRLSMGWLFLYAGITKVLNPDWTSAGYLKGAQTFSELYQFLASPGIVSFVDFGNQWGLTLIGISLILGIFVRFSSIFGAILMLLYYFPVLNFPYVGEHSLLVEEHIIYALALGLLAAIGAGKIWGIDGKILQTRSVLRKLV
tara:strand:+ start:335 stop:784 length:450 start_codon:yes stop_codon:yes gene_type:complete